MLKKEKAPDTEFEYLSAGLERMEKDIAQAEEIAKQENPYAEKVKALSDRLNQLNREIAETLVDDDKQAAETAPKEEAEEEKTSSNRKYSLDNSDNIRDNVSEEVFDKYLTEGIMQMVQDTVSKEIGEYVDLSKMRDPVARDEARDKLPYIRNLLFQYNEMRHYAETKPEYLDRQAVKIEYARRCFDNADEIRREVARGLEQHTRSEGMGTSGNADLSGDDKGARRSSGARGTRGVSRSVGHEKHGAREHFEKLYNEQMAKHSNQGAFSNAKHFSIDGKPIVGVRKYSAAWHGSPHKFDTFSLEAIGTGEGAQAHGWGLYFAKERRVSESYKEVLRHNKDEVLVDGEVWQAGFHKPCLVDGIKP